MFRLNDLVEATGAKLIGVRANRKIFGISIDSRTIKPGEAFVAIKGKNYDGHDFILEAIKKRAKAVIREPHSFNRRVSANTSFLIVKDTFKALADIAKARRKKFDIPVIAVTGSNGKTTTKEMISWVLSKKFKILKNEGTKNNQIGLPLALLKLNSSHHIAVLEIGSNHFGEVGRLSQICLPQIGVITNIAPAHLEFFRSLEGVFREKYTLIKNLKKPAIGLLNADDKFLRKFTMKSYKHPVIFGFGISNRTDFFASDIKIYNGKTKFLVNRKFRFVLNTSGVYNIYNVLVAVAIARIFGLEYKDIADRLSKFEFPSGRLQLIKLKNIKFIDDTYNSNPFSLNYALSTLKDIRIKGRKIFVMGDMLELGGQQKVFHKRAGRQAAKVCDIFITVGRLSKFAASAAKKSGFNIGNLFTCSSNQQARNILYREVSINPDDVVLVKGSRLMKMEEIFKGS